MGKKRNSDLRDCQQQFMNNIKKKQKEYMMEHEGMDEAIVDEIMKNKHQRKRKEV